MAFMLLKTRQRQAAIIRELGIWFLLLFISEQPLSDQCYYRPLIRQGAQSISAYLHKPR